MKHLSKNNKHKWLKIAILKVKKGVKIGVLRGGVIVDNEKIISFDLEGFKKELTDWHNDIQEFLKEDELNIRLRIVNDVLNSVEDIMYDNTVFDYGEE